MAIPDGGGRRGPKTPRKVPVKPLGGRIPLEALHELKKRQKEAQEQARPLREARGVAGARKKGEFIGEPFPQWLQRVVREQREKFGKKQPLIDLLGQPGQPLEWLLGQGMYRTLQREGEVPERFRGIPKAEAEYELARLLKGLSGPERDFVIGQVARITYSGPERILRAAQQIVDKALYLPPAERDVVVQKILRENQQTSRERAARVMWSPLLPLGLWKGWAAVPVNPLDLYKPFDAPTPPVPRPFWQPEWKYLLRRLRRWRPPELRE